MQAQNTVKATAVNTTNANQSATRHLRVKTRLKAGRIAINTNQTLVRSRQDNSDGKAGDSTPAPGQSAARHLRVKTRLKAGRIANNTNQTLVRSRAAQTTCRAGRHARG
jgi:hypothetical protein